MKTSELFKYEIDCMTNETFKNIVINTLDSSPKCIQTIPASSSGKYHPKQDLIVGKINDDGSVDIGGLVYHIRAVVGIALSLIGTDIFNNIIKVDDDLIETYKDIVIASCLLHDCCKADDNDLKHRTLFNHPLLASKLFKDIAKKYITKDNMDYMKIIIPETYNAISSHMGQWNMCNYSKDVLPKPKTSIETFVHMCDYIASRKFIDFDFDKYYN